MTTFPTGSQVIQITNLFTEINYKIFKAYKENLLSLKPRKYLFLFCTEHLIEKYLRTLDREIFVPFLHRTLEDILFVVGTQRTRCLKE